jgi:arylsulfatase
MKILKIMLTSLLTGLFVGWLWGFLEGVAQLSIYFIGILSRTGALPPFAILDAIGIPLMAGALYAGVMGLLSLILTPPAIPVLRRLPWKLDVTGPLHASLTVCLTSIAFFNLYWWSRSILFYGIRFHDPRRLAATAVFAAVAFLLALVIVKAVWRKETVRPTAPLVFLLLALTGSAVFFVREDSIALGPPPPDDGKKRLNVVLIVPDALRADHLGCYGYEAYERPVSPFIDGLAEEAVVFEKAVTQAPYTWTSFGSFLTGKFPRKHGLIKMDPTQRLDLQDNVTMAEIMSDDGYLCGAFMMGAISIGNGLLQGFDIYFEAVIGHDPASVHSKWSIFRSDLTLMHLYNKLKQARDPALVNTLAREFIKEHRDRPFFLMVHYFATHTPYDPPEPYKSMYDPDYEGKFDIFTQKHNFAVMDGRLEMSDRDLQRIRALYDGGVTFTDQMVSELYATLEEEGLLDDTLLILTSDHGEELYDHMVFEHDWMYNTNLRVPLIIRFPGAAHGGTRVSTPVGLIDLLPTVMDVAGVGASDEVKKEIDGRSLRGLLDGSSAYASGTVYQFDENNRYLAVEDGKFKLIRYRWPDKEEPDRLFDLVADPYETANVKDRFPREYERLARVLEEHDASMPTNMKTYEEDPELYKRLFELGYIQGNSPLLEGEIEKKK